MLNFAATRAALTLALAGKSGMQQFTVPQFIDVEDKIIGAISVRQFLILLAGGMCAFIFYKLADFTLFIFLAVVDLALTGTFAFFRVNGVPFHFFLLNLLQTLKRPGLRVWHNEVSLAEIKAELRKPKEEQVADAVQFKKPLQGKPLADLALLVDTGGVYRGE